MVLCTRCQYTPYAGLHRGRLSSVQHGKLKIVYVPMLVPVFMFWAFVFYSIIIAELTCLIFCLKYLQTKYLVTMLRSSALLVLREITHVFMHISISMFSPLAVCFEFELFIHVPYIMMMNTGNSNVVKTLISLFHLYLVFSNTAYILKQK